MNISDTLWFYMVLRISGPRWLSLELLSNSRDVWIAAGCARPALLHTTLETSRTGEGSAWAGTGTKAQMWKWETSGCQTGCQTMQSQTMQSAAARMFREECLGKDMGSEECRLFAKECHWSRKSQVRRCLHRDTYRPVILSLDYKKVIVRV